MKKITKLLVLVMLFVFSFALFGCSSDDSRLIALEQAVGDFQTVISELQDDRDILLDEIDLLNKEISELEKNKDSQNSVIASLRTKIQEAQAKVEDYEKQIEVLTEKISAVRPEITVELADQYTLVVGDNFQLFYRSVVQAPDPYGYYIKLEGTKGHMYNRYYEFKPEANEVGTYNLKLSVCDANGVEYGSDETKLVVVPATVTNGETKNILCFGDSLTANGVWVAQGISKYINAGYKNVKTIGSMTSTLNGVTVKYEGNSGWQWETYVKGSNDKSTPFLKADGSGISFKEYATKYGVSEIHEVYILLTWNGIGGSFREFSFDDKLFSNAKKIIDTFHQEFPKGKVTLIGIPKPSMNAGLGAYYALDKAYADNYGQTVTVMNYNKFLEDWTKMDEYKDFLFYIDGMGQFDSEYNMPTQSKPVNNQNSTTELVGNAMGMHPNNQGYLQIGDTFFRALRTDKSK